MDQRTIEQQVTFLHSADLDKTDDFYQGLLNLPLVLDQGVCRIYQIGRDAFIGFCRHLEPLPDPEGIILTLVSQQVDEWYAYLRRHNVPIDKPPTYNEQYNIYHCFLRDPDNYRLEIQRFLDPAWPKGS